MKILVAESRDFNPSALDLLRGAGEVRCEQWGREELSAGASDVEVLWVRLASAIDAEVMDGFPALRFIVSPTTGLNHIDLEKAERRNIRVLSLRGEADFLKTVRATAEHTLALALALLRNLPAAAADVAAGNWDRDAFRGGELAGKTAGIVGLGRLGRIVAEVCAALGMEVHYFDPYVESVDYARSSDLSDLSDTSDIVFLHAALTEETTGMIGESFFASLKPGAWLVNTARGEIVDEAALLAALESGRLAGAALDVLANEHDLDPDGHPLIAYARTHSNLLITPHIGGCTLESMHKTEAFMAEKLCAALSSA